MRIVNWLFVVSVALFISGIGFVIAAARTVKAAPAEAPVTIPVASIKQIMNGIVSPASTVVYESISTTVSARGVEEKAPSNDEEWAAVGNAAAALVESANLMMIGSRVVDRGDWVKMSRALADASIQALKATEAKDTNAVLDAGSAINQTCDACHQRYRRD